MSSSFTIRGFDSSDAYAHHQQLNQREPHHLIPRMFCELAMACPTPVADPSGRLTMTLHVYAE